MTAETATVSLLEREKCLRKVAGHLGAASKNLSNLKDSAPPTLQPGQVDSGAEIEKYLVHDSASENGGATCSFPSLDLNSGEASALPLPNVGTSAGMQPAQIPVNSAGKPQIPNMSAAVFNGAMGKPALPQMSAGVGVGVSKPSEHQNASANAAMLEQAAAKNLGLIKDWNVADVKLAPMTMLTKLAASFSALVDARVRAWMLLFLRQSLSSGDEQSRAHLMKLLATSQNIDLLTMKISFNALTLPATLQEESGGDEEQNSREVVLPLLFEVVSNVVLHQEKVVAKLRAPGTLLGKFAPTSLLMTEVKINLDTKALVASMVEQARLVVFKAVASATSFQARQQRGPVQRFAPSASQEAKHPAPSPAQPPMNVPPPATALPRRPSVLKQSSLIPKERKESSGPTLKMKATRSVTWSNSVDTQERKSSQINLSLKSSKSFGKPGADTFEINRNATFAEFGRSVNQATHTFVNGKLKQNPNAFSMAQISAKPKPNGEFVMKQRNAEFSAASVSMTKNLGRKNYSFSLSQTSGFERAPSKSGMSAGQGLRRAGNSRPVERMDSIPQPMLPRTPTALEGLLLQKAQQRTTY